MARIFCVLLAVLCLSACGSSGTDADAAPPQAIPLEQESDATESDAQASADAESDAAPEIAEEARFLIVRQAIQGVGVGSRAGNGQGVHPGLPLGFTQLQQPQDRLVLIVVRA